jgi:LPXTG-motif cell wall-anchored protein
MKRLFVLSAVLVLSLALATSALAQSDMARVRVVHASPDAPAVDVWVNGNVAFSNAPFQGITDYAALDAGSYQVQVTPTGATEPVVIDATLDLAGGTDYTVVAVGLLADIEPLVLVDNNSAPAAGKAHVRFVHASPDAPAVDIAVTGGPVLFSNVPFKGVGDYLPVDAGTYDLEARLAGTETVALSVPGVQLNEGTVYTIFAMGLAGGEPALTAVPSVDAVAPTQLPETGGEVGSLWLVALLGAGLALIGGGLVLRRKSEIAA